MWANFNNWTFQLRVRWFIFRGYFSSGVFVIIRSEVKNRQDHSSHNG